MPENLSAELQNILNNLRSHTPAAPGQTPTPANMPRRRPQARTAAEIAQAEGLNLDLQAPASAAPRPRPRPTRPRQRNRVSFKEWIFMRILETPTGRDRARAWDLAEQWSRTVSGPDEFIEWAEGVGMGRPHAAVELKDHRFLPADLATVIAGKPARSWIRADRDVESVIAFLYREATARRQAATTRTWRTR
ncbi:hypothetical protein ACWCQL_31685 [Streptomyces sp. NPDC002073]